MPVVDLQRLGGPPGPAERTHEQFDAPVAPRFARLQRFEVRDRVRRTPRSQREVGVVLDRGRAQFVQPRRLRAGEVAVGELGIRRAAPQCEGRLEQSGGGGVRGVRGPLAQRFEPQRIHAVGGDVQPVSGNIGADQFGAQCGAQPGQHGLQGGLRMVREPLAPGRLDERRPPAPASRPGSAARRARPAAGGWAAAGEQPSRSACSVPSTRNTGAASHRHSFSQR